MSTSELACVTVPLNKVSIAIQYGLTAKSGTGYSGAQYLRITDIQNNDIDWSNVPFCNLKPEELEKYQLEVGQIVFARTGATVGKSILLEDVPDRAVFASYLIRVIPDAKFVDNNYLSHFFQSDQYWDQITSGAGGTGQPNFNGKKLANLQVPLPPLAEQKRIVAKLDALEESQAAVRAALERVENLVWNFKERVLSAAFRGMLNHNSRELLETKGERWPLPSSWKWQAFGEIAEIAANLVSPADFPEATHLAPNHIQQGSRKAEGMQSVREDGVTSAKHHFYPGQIVFSKIRPYLRKAVLVDYEGLCSADMYPINCGKDIDPLYLLYWLTSDDFVVAVSQHQGRTVLPKVNQHGLKATRLPVPPLEEQREIIKRIETVFAEIDTLATAAAAARRKIDRLDRAILAKAFRGELVPQDSNDEPASVLLERIKLESG